MDADLMRKPISPALDVRIKNGGYHNGVLVACDAMPHVGMAELFL